MLFRSPKAPLSLECGGVPMLEQNVVAGTKAPGAPGFMQGTQVGKRYVDGEVAIELLCVKSGEGSLSVNQRALAVKDAKRLPASD